VLNIRLQEIALPTSQRDEDSLITWLIESLSLLRRRGEVTADGDVGSPIHRLLKERVFAHPNLSWDSNTLADDLALTSASLHHHLTRLLDAGLLGSGNDGGRFRRYFLRGGGLEQAIEYIATNAKLILEQRLLWLTNVWNRKDVGMEIELPDDDPLPTILRIREYRPLLENSEMSEMTHWMADIGLLGDRPGAEAKADSLSERLFTLLLNRSEPLSIDEAAELVEGPKPRVGRILERFRATGMVERVPRTDRLASALWSAMTTQHSRRGSEWLLGRGGFQRFDVPQKVLTELEKGKLTIDSLKKHVIGIEVRDRMLLLNLLGGRLPLGHRLAGESVDMVKRKVLDRLDRILRRLRRMSEMLSDAIE